MAEPGYDEVGEPLVKGVVSSVATFVGQGRWNRGKSIAFVEKAMTEAILLAKAEGYSTSNPAHQEIFRNRALEARQKAIDFVRNLALVVLLTLFATPVAAQCIVGVSQVPCDLPPLRTVSVSTITGFRAALATARPGDHIVLTSVLDGSASTSVHGTAAAPIVISGGHIRPATGNSNDAFNLNHNYYIYRKSEVSRGWHGIQVNGRYVLLEDLNVHDTGLTVHSSGQGILVLNSDVAIVRLTQARAGLTTVSPKMVHGVYISDYYGRNVARVSLVNSTLKENGGAGLHVWNSSRRTTDLYVSGNTFERNAIDVVLTNVDRATLSNNTIIQNGAPQTDYTVRAWLLLELSTALKFVANRFSAIGGCSLFAGYSQSLMELKWSSNIWSWPAGCAAFGDAELNYAGR